MLEAAVARLEQVTARLEATEVRCRADHLCPPDTVHVVARHAAATTPLMSQARLASIAPGGVAPTRGPPPPTAAAAAAPAAAPAVASADGRAVADYRQLLSTQLVKVLDAAEAIGGQVLQASRVLAEGFRGEAAVVEAIGACQVSHS